ncbi:NERD domain-containing protein [Luteimonas mephitis]|uniref:nuclease-related domain-containing protein n=1 Tax=Luteimonas mephitis TaxID=83615 RepID=UPI003A95D864
MLIKAADDQGTELQLLEQRAGGNGPDAKRATKELRIRKAGLRGERDSAYLIDFDYAASPNWAVIHDLRLEHGNRTAQIDHLLINRWMDVYVLETKHFHAGIKITEDGEFLRWNNYQKTYEGMASPLEQNERHIQVIKDVMAQIELPTRLGVRIPPAFQSFVLVGPEAKIYRPRRFDASRVVKADQLKKAIWRDIDSENVLIGMLRTAAKIVSGETVEFVARQLAARHQPKAGAPAMKPAPYPGAATAARGRPTRIEPTFTVPAPDPAPSPTGPACKECSGRAGSILYGKFGYYFKCDGCGKNTAIRFNCQPGHQPRLRKDRDRFYRECADCGSSELFHRNAPSGVTP